MIQSSDKIKKPDWLGRVLEKIRLRAVMPLIHGRLLDIGCGMNNLIKAYGNGVGVDVFDWGRVDLVVQDTSRLPIADNEFETITIIAALNHIPNREAVLKECHRLLKSGGRLIITMLPPKISKIWHKLRSKHDLDQRARGMSDGEVYGLTETEVINMTQSAGFRLELTKHFMLINRLYVFIVDK